MLDIPDPYGPFVRGVALTAVAVLWTVLLVRIVGLRAFSKMTAFDFVATIATGSLIAQAGTRSDWPAFFQCMAAIAGVFLVQWLLARARMRSNGFGNVIRNTPVLLMENGVILADALEATRVSRASVLEKLRAANVSGPDAVRAMVLETTGDISVLHQEEVDETLLEGVKRV